MKGVGSTLRFIRRALGVVCFMLVTWFFVDYGMSIPSLATWLTRVQFIPAALSFSLGIFLFWLLVTIIFGRIYCSTVCPLGVFQDICARLPRLGKVKAKWHYHYRLPHQRLRIVILALVVVSVCLGISAVTSLLDPYSVFGRFASYCLRPLYGGTLNIVAEIEGDPRVRIMAASLFGIILSGVMMLIVGTIAFLSGRTICNTICPVGTTLGFVSRNSLFRIDINTDKCIQCRRCEHKCKSSCIDMISHVVDTSRCVACFDCLTDCPNDAITYTWRRHRLSIPLMQPIKPMAGSASSLGDSALEMNGESSMESQEVSIDDPSRRKFLTLTALIGASPLMLEAKRVKDGIEAVASGSGSFAALPVTPPGARSRTEFLNRCTSCGLCIDHCPQKVLRPSTGEYGVLRTLHPVMDFDMSWCLYDCTRCSRVCPTGALHPLTASEKHHTRIGYARTVRDYCISFTGESKCGACSRRCPTEAITMAPAKDGKGPYPVVNRDLCIGCGACQYVCPAVPKAIVVSGIS